MSERQPYARDLVVAYIEALNARTWVRLAELLADDVVYEIPQTGEFVRGRDAVVRFNREYPGDWQLTIRDAYGDASGGAVHFGFRVGGDELNAVAFLRFDEDGLIGRITDYWPEPYEPPPGREHLVERPEPA